MITWYFTRHLTRSCVGFTDHWNMPVWRKNKENAFVLFFLLQPYTLCMLFVYHYLLSQTNFGTFVFPEKHKFPLSWFLYTPVLLFIPFFISRFQMNIFFLTSFNFSFKLNELKVKCKRQWHPIWNNPYWHIIQYLNVCKLDLNFERPCNFFSFFIVWKRAARIFLKTWYNSEKIILITGSFLSELFL